MICPKCGNETSGNYCNNCGAPLVGRLGAEIDGAQTSDGPTPSEVSDYERALEWERRNQNAAGVSRERQAARKKEKSGGSSKKQTASRESSKANQKEKKQLEKRIRTLEEERRQREKEGRRKEENGFSDGGGRRIRSRRNPGREDSGDSVRIIRETEEAGGSVGGSLANAAVKGVTGVVILMSRIMQICCFLLMAGMVWASARAFWFCSDGLGNINTMITDRNYSLALYVGAAAFSLFMGVIWCLWIMSRKAAGGNIRLKKYDTGRGFIPFILCAAVVFAAGPASMLIPADGAAWHGLAAGAGAILEAINSNHGFLVFCSVAGTILSLVRKVLRV